jgi:hypothetical protein
MSPTSNLLGRGRLGQNDGFRTGAWELPQGGFMAVIALVLTDDDDVWYRKLVERWEQLRF